MKSYKWKFEYWPWKVVYFPVFIKYLGYSLLERNPFYFYAVNPGIETGGLLIESKYNILQKIPKKYLPKTQLVDISKITLTKFPVIIKPEFGERGVSVEKITCKEDFERYKKNNSQERNYMIQEFIDLPVEVGVFYYVDPKTNKGTISSITIKKFLSVEGDGKSSIEELMEKQVRHSQQIERLAQNIDLKRVPQKGEQVLLEPIGNHNRGTTFLDGNHLITPQLIKVFDELSSQIEGFYYGRFDIKAESFEALEQGEFKILELNGAKSEPTHIYHPNYSMRKAYQSLFSHWRAMHRIARANKKSGHTYPSISQGIKDYKKYKKYH